MEKNKIANYLVTFASGVLVALFLFKEEPAQPKTEYIATNTIDTVYVPKPYPVVKTVTKYVPTPINVIPGEYDEQSHELMPDKKNYQDSLLVEPNFILTYDAWTTGDLDSIKLGYVDNRPTKIIQRETIITKTVTNDPSGLYIGGTVNSNINATADLSYLKGKNMYGIGVSTDKSISVIYRRKIL